MDKLGVLVLLVLAAAAGWAAWHASRRKDWLRDRALPLLLVGVCFLAGAVVTVFGHSLVNWLNPGFLNTIARDPPGGVSGPDLVANLLTITALMASACLAYLSLPTDRFEARMSTYVKAALLEHLIEVDDFEEFYECASADLRNSPACRAIRGLLSVREGMGGWFRMKEEELHKLFPEHGKQFSKFVNEHLDESWVRVLLSALGVGVVLGLICLGFRYFGAVDKHFSAAEFGVIISLVLLNLMSGALAAALTIGGRSGEIHMRIRIELYVQDLKPHFQEYHRNRLKTGLSEAKAEAKRRAARKRPPTQPS